ncbi:TonB-dependent receptor [soil metagenome]
MRRLLFVPWLLVATTAYAHDEKGKPEDSSAAPPSPATATDAPIEDVTASSRDADAADKTKDDAPETVKVHGDTPPHSASATKRDAADLHAAPHRTGSDMLLTLPGMFVTQHSGEGKAHQLFFRGFDAVHGQDLELWVGGAPVNDVSNLHGQGYADLHFVIAEAVREIELLPGTFDPRQGDFAVAGTVRYKLGLDEPGLHAKLTFGSFGTERGYMGWRPTEGDKETFAAVEAFQSNGFGPSRASQRASGMAQIRHAFSGGLVVRALASAYAGRFDSAGVILRRDFETGRIDPFSTYDPHQGGNSARAQLVVELEHDDEGTRWQFAPFFVLRRMTLRSDFTGYLEDPVNGDNVEQRSDAITFGTTASFRKTLKVFRADDAIATGMYVRQDIIDQQQNRVGRVDDDPTKALVNANVGATDIAGWLDVALHPLSRVVVRGGLRVDALYYTSTDDVKPLGSIRRSAAGIALGPRVSVDVGILPGLRAIGSYGMGFRSPQARSLADGETTPFARVNSFELGVKYKPGQYFEASLAAFHTRLSQDLVFDPVTTRNEIVPSTQRTGVSADMTVRARSDFRQIFSITYARATFTGSDQNYNEGDLLPYAPQLIARSDTSYDPVIGTVLGRKLRGHIGMGLSLLAARPLPYGETGRNAMLTDVGIGARLGEIELDCDAYNLFDDRWFDGEFVYASNFNQGATPTLVPQRHVTMGSPRTFFVSLAIHLGGTK